MSIITLISLRIFIDIVIFKIIRIQFLENRTRNILRIILMYFFHRVYPLREFTKIHLFYLFLKIIL